MFACNSNKSVSSNNGHQSGNSSTTNQQDEHKKETPLTGKEKINANTRAESSPERAGEVKIVEEIPSPKLTPQQEEALRKKAEEIKKKKKG